MPQACGERIITPSNTACPPTRVSSPLSRAGSSCTAVKKRKICHQLRIPVGCCIEEGRLAGRIPQNSPSFEDPQAYPLAFQSFVLPEMRNRSPTNIPYIVAPPSTLRIESKGDAAFRQDLQLDCFNHQEAGEDNTSCAIFAVSIAEDFRAGGLERGCNRRHLSFRASISG